MTEGYTAAFGQNEIQYNPLTYYESALNTYQVVEPNDIVGTLCEIIRKGDYIVIWLDSRVTKAQENAPSIEDIHEELIFGFDENKQVFYKTQLKN